jgi:hypothetical protein
VAELVREKFIALLSAAVETFSAALEQATRDARARGWIEDTKGTGQ